MENGLDVYGGPKRCLSFGSHRKEAQEISEVRVGGNHIQVHLSAIWSVQCAKNFHKAAEASHGLPALSRIANGHLPGRYPHTGREQRHPVTPGVLHNPAIRTIGVHYQPSKVHTRANPPYCLSWTSDRLGSHETSPARGEGSTYYQQLLPGTVKGGHHSTSVGRSDWQNVSSPPSSVTYTPSPPAPSTPTDPDTESFRFLQVTSDTEPRLPGQTDVMDSLTALLEQIGHLYSPSRPDNTVRCLTERMGGRVQWDSNGRSLDGAREEVTHKLPRATSRIVCNQGIHETSEQHPSPPENGKPLCSSIRKQDGGTHSLNLSLQACHLW